REVRRVVEARDRAPIPRTVENAGRRDCPRVRLQHDGRNAAGLRPKPGRDAARIPAAILLKAIPPPRTRLPAATESDLTRRSRRRTAHLRLPPAQLDLAHPGDRLQPPERGLAPRAP